MSVSLMPSVRPLATAVRAPGQEFLIPFARQLKKYPRFPELQQRLYDLATDWPFLGRNIRKVEAKSLGINYAETTSFCVVSVEGRLIINKDKLLDPLTDQELLGMHDTGYCIGSCWEDVLDHEWGHLLFQVPIHRRYPQNLDLGFESVVRVLEKRSGVRRDEAARSYSLLAQRDNKELLAEGFAHAEKYGATSHPFSREIYRLISDLWIPDASDEVRWSA